MNPAHRSNTPALRLHLQRGLRALIVGLALIGLSSSSFAFDVYRGLIVNVGKLDLSPATFNFNPALSLFDMANVQTQPVGPYKCLLRVELDQAPIVNAEASAVDFSKNSTHYKVLFDDQPKGHYSMQKIGSKGNGTAISTTLHNLHSHDRTKYQSLIVNGSDEHCNELEAEF